MRSLPLCVVAALAIPLASACDLPQDEHSTQSSVDSVRRGRNPRADNRMGRQLFDRETFGGNGRTCLTCHDVPTGTISPETAQRLFAQDPDHPLFRPIDSDDGVGNSYTRLLTHATILAGVNLADNVHVADDPDARGVKLPRGILTTLNAPAFDPVVMWDGREASITTQARGAIFGHAQPGRDPTDAEVQAIVNFESRAPRFFSSVQLLLASRAGRDPVLPDGRTESQTRGRAVFDSRCSFCHGGPMLNTTRRGGRFANVGVSERNALGNPTRTYVFTAEDGTETAVDSADPGRALVTGDTRDIGSFKIPILWGIKKTAPYFHDNSAADLTAVVDHYDFFFIASGRPGLSEQEKADLVEFMLML